VPVEGEVLSVAVVVKVGGGMLARVGDLDAVLAEIGAASRAWPLLVVPGGGPFANVVRDVDRQVGLPDDAAHWMAILAMDQYAQLIVSRLANSKLVSSPREILLALHDRCIPVLAPYQWMRDADPLPHSWDVTSDSISAWIAGQVGATRLVLVKPEGASASGIVDPCFNKVLPCHIEAAIVTADRIADLAKFIAALAN
jgi:aspartokinase-like uncharacterized kinase